MQTNSTMDEIDPGQAFLRVNILRWREIFRMIETSGGDIDLVGPPVGFIRQRRSAAVAKGSPRSCFRLISAWCSFHELELRTFYYYPSYCLSPGGSSAVCTMTICTDSDLGRRAETYFATITATGNFILFHAIRRKLGMVTSTPRGISAKLAGVGAACQRWMVKGEQSGLLTRIVTMESVSSS